MKRYIEGVSLDQGAFFPDHLEDWIEDGNVVRVIDAFVDALDLPGLGFELAEATGRPGYHPSALLKLYVYGYLNRVQSSRRLERETLRNVEVMWLLGRLSPDHKTIADFRKDNGEAIRKVCAQFVELCREIGLLAVASVAIDGSKFKVVNNRDRNFTRAKMQRRKDQIAKSVTRYLEQLDSADRQEPSPAKDAKKTKGVFGTDELDVVADRGYFNSTEILACDQAGITVTLPKPSTSGAKSKGRYGKQDFRYVADEGVYICPAGNRLTYRYTRCEDGLDIRRYWTDLCSRCSLKAQCTPSKQRRVSRWKHEEVLEAVQQRLDENPQAMRQRRETVEHPFGTIKMRMGATHFLMKRLKNVRTEMALSVLAYNLTRVINILGVTPLIQAIRA